MGVSVNCYLVQTSDGFVLIDTGRASKRGAIKKALEDAGCRPGNLKLIVLTHGDFDHCGNAAYLRREFSTRIAIHDSDSGMAEHGDFFWNRKCPHVLIRTIFGLFFRLADADPFKADLYLEEGDDLSASGFDARVVALPGHSKGSLGFLTADGDLFCGDLLGNTNKPEVWSLVDDPAAMKASVERLKSLRINTVYPGHGEPFPMTSFLKIDGRSNQEG